MKRARWDAVAGAAVVVVLVGGWAYLGVTLVAALKIPLIA